MEVIDILVDTLRNPPFKGRFLSDHGFFCQDCKAQILRSVKDGIGWGSQGWMCAKIKCPNSYCNRTYLMTDSRLFCLTCDRDRTTCGEEIQIFVRDDLKGSIIQ